jgi:photosystem II stability/assembly factor-like uncharacterized protein
MIFKIKSILVLLLGIFLTGNTNGQWTTEKCPTTNNLNSICVFNLNSGWIVGDKGTIIYMNNGAWREYQKVTKEDLNSIFFITQDEGWAVGSKGTILHFIGGKWEELASLINRDLYSVSFKDSEHGIAVGAQGTVVIYENGTWKLAEKATMGNLYAVSSKSDLSIIGGGLESMSIPVMTMPDSPEENPVKSFDPGFVEIRGLAIPDKKNVWAVGRPGTIFHFDGSNWKRLEQFEKLPSLKSVFFSDINKGIAVGYGGTILTYSIEGWTKEVPPVNVTLNGAFISENKYYVIGNNGTIVSSKRAPESEASHISKNNNLLKIETYPNPSTDKLNIIIPDEDSFVAERISVSNVNGLVVFNKSIDPGTGSQVYQINTSELNNGLYLVNITSSGGIGASGKFIVKH